MFDQLKAHYKKLLVLCSILLPMLLLSFGDAPFDAFLQFDRALIGEGQWWRLYTGNYVHFGWYHTFMNVGGMLAIAYLVFWCRFEREWWVSMATIPWGVGLGLYFFDADTDIYKGFSGAAYGVLMAGFILEWKYNRVVMSLALAVLIGKIVIEQLPNYDVDYLQREIGVSVAISAHLWGVVSGTLVGLVLAVHRQLKKTSVIE